MQSETFTIIFLTFYAILYIIGLSCLTWYAYKKRKNIFNSIRARKKTYKRVGDTFVLDKNITEEDWKKVAYDWKKVGSDLQHILDMIDEKLSNIPIEKRNKETIDKAIEEIKEKIRKLK